MHLSNYSELLYFKLYKFCNISNGGVKLFSLCFTSCVMYGIFSNERFISLIKSYHHQKVKYRQTKVLTWWKWMTYLMRNCTCLIRVGSTIGSIIIGLTHLYGNDLTYCLLESTYYIRRYVLRVILHPSSDLYGCV